MHTHALPALRRVFEALICLEFRTTRSAIVVCHVWSFYCLKRADMCVFEQELPLLNPPPSWVLLHTAKLYCAPMDPRNVGCTGCHNTQCTTCTPRWSNFHCHSSASTSCTVQAAATNPLGPVQNVRQSLLRPLQLSCCEGRWVHRAKASSLQAKPMPKPTPLPGTIPPPPPGRSVGCCQG